MRWLVAELSSIVAVRLNRSSAQLIRRSGLQPIRWLRRYISRHGGPQDIGIHEIVPGEANFLMFHLDESHPTAEQVIARARETGVFVRDVASMGVRIQDRQRFCCD